MARAETRSRPDPDSKPMTSSTGAPRARPGGAGKREARPAPRRLLLVNYEYPPLGGGAAHATAHLATELARRGCEIRVMTSRFRDQRAEATEDGVVVHRIPVVRLRDDRCSTPEMLSFLLSALVQA